MAFEENKARARARTSVINDPSPGSVVEEPEVEVDVVDPYATHESRELRWHNKHLKLTNPCLPLLRGNQCVLRLLQCGVVPAKGAKVPEHLKKRNWSPGKPR